MDNYSLSAFPDENEKKQLRRYYSAAGLMILIDVALFQGASRLFMALAGLLTGHSGGFAELMEAGGKAIAANELVNVLFGCGFPIIAEVTAIVFGAKMLNINIWEKFNRDGFDGKEIAGATAVSFLGQTAASFILSIILMLFGGIEQQAQNTITVKTSLLANILMYTYVCLLGPVIEEILFRGLVLESMRKYNERFAVVFSSIIFGLMHCNVVQAVNGFLVGLVFGTVYVRSRSLVPSSVLHIIMNTFTSICSVMMTAGIDINKYILSGSFSSISELTIAGLGLNLLVRILSLPVGIAVLVITAGNCFGLRKAYLPDKKRCNSHVLSSPAWIAAIAIYTVICIYNFV